MKKVFITLSTLLLTLSSAFAQAEDLAKLQEIIRENKVSADYSFVYGGKLKCNGFIIIQDPCYKAEGNGIEVYCDGDNRWTVDRVAKEVYIEKTSGPEDYLQYLSEITDLKLGNVKKEPRDETAEFYKFDEKNLDSSWVVTDLR